MCLARNFFGDESLNQSFQHHGQKLCKEISLSRKPEGRQDEHISSNFPAAPPSPMEPQSAKGGLKGPGIRQSQTRV